MSEGAAQWDRFVANGVSAITELDDIVGSLGPDTLVDPTVRGQLYQLAYRCFGLASQSLLVGAENIGRLALACERGLDALGDGALGGEALAPLAAATGMLRAAFQQLANPDESGARVEGLDLAGVTAELDATLPARLPELHGSHKAQRAAAVVARHAIPLADQDEEPASERGPGPADDDSVWEPQLDDDMIELFFEEANDRLEAVSQKLVELEQRPGDGELVREIFRDLHTVKGSSGMVGLRRLNRLAHAAEDLVGEVREGQRPVDGAVVDALLAALDGLRAILERASERATIDVAVDPLVQRLRNPSAAPAATPEPTPASAPAGDGGDAPRPAAHAARQTIRVDFDKLDLLMNLVGELVLGRDELHGAIQSIGALSNELTAERQLTRRLAVARRRDDARVDGGAALRQLGDEIGRVERVMVDISQDLDRASGRLDSISGELRDQVMKLRMIPIGGAFRKHHRTIRDLSHAMNKRVQLELHGEETELDKVLVEMLEDPLMHLVRNAVDHGVESPEQRAAAGKSDTATVRLRAMHRGNQVVIEIQDDGAGIDPNALRAKALEKDVCTEEELATLDDRAALALIFRPGFSTAEKVTDVSGRGVGMDVVWSTIVNKLKGQVDISSELGVGTTLTLRLPLTLAIIQVLLVRSGGEVFAVPLDGIIRTTTRSPSDVGMVQNREVIAVQDQQVPLIRLADVLELTADPYSSPDALHIVLIEVGGEMYGLACDYLLGKREIVIKSLGDLLRAVPCAAGATLIGDRCAIILDVPAIVGRALRGHGRRERRETRSPIATGDVAPHILLVEDSDVVRESLARLLTDAGYRCTTARDGVEGLEMARAGKFDLISTDVMMPRMDGYELTRALRATPEYHDVPIVMVTSRGERIDRVRGFDAGVDEYITKPHDRSQLRRVIAKLLASRDDEEESP